jgi:hypothetical protein
MKRNQSIFILTLILFCITKTFSQSDFRNGYIINNQQDTIFGLLEYKGSKSNTYKCIYRKNMNSKEQIFSPKDIKGYRYSGGKYYISKKVKIGNKTELLFLEYLINGVVDIFYYRNNGDNYLVNSDSDKLYELNIEEKEFFIDQTKYSKKIKKYIGILKSTFKDSPSIIKRIEKVGLNHESLINITRDYHTEVCSTEECIVYEKQLPKIEKIFGVLVGINSMSISKTNNFHDNFYYLNNLDFGNNIFPSIGIYYKMNMPYINEHFYFQYEGTYSRVKLEANNLYIESFHNMTVKNDITLTLNSFNNMFMFKREYSKGKIRPMFQFGCFVDYFFKPDYNRNIEVRFSSGDLNYITNSKNNPFIKFDYGISLGLGLKSFYIKDKEMFIDLKYKRGFGLLVENLNTNSFLLNLGFQIGK